MITTKNSRYILAAILFGLTASILYLVSPQLSFFFILGIIGIFGILTIAYPPAFWLICAFTFIIFESEQYRLGIFPLPLLQYPLIALLNMILVMVTLYNLFILRGKTVKFDIYDKLIYLFLIGTVLSAGIGLIHGYTMKAVGKELGLVMGYFAFITMRRTSKSILKIIPPVLSIALLFLFLEYVYLARIVIASPYLLTTRVVTRQAVLALPAVSVGTSFMLWSNSIRKKLTGLVMFIIFTPIIILSMQRALWIAVLTGIIISIAAGFFSSRNNRRKAVYMLVIVFLILLLIITAGLIIVNYFFSDNYLNLLNARMTSVQTVNNVIQDKSYQVRTGDMENVFKKLQRYPYAIFIGRGLGDRILRRFPFSEYIAFIDNTYLVILWKMGGIFLLLYLMIFFYNIRYFFRISLRTENNGLAIGLLSFLCALFVFMLGTNLGMIYRFITVFWGLIGIGFAYYGCNMTNQEKRNNNPMSAEK